MHDKKLNARSFRLKYYNMPIDEINLQNQDYKSDYKTKNS